MNIAVIGNRSSDKAIEVCCSFLSFKGYDYSIFVEAQVFDAQFADLVIIAQPFFESQQIVANKFFIVSARCDVGKIPNNADYVLASADDEEIIFRLSRSLEAISQSFSADDILLNTIFDASSIVQMLIGKDGAVQRFKMHADIDNPPTSDMILTNGKLSSGVTTDLSATIREDESQQSSIMQVAQYVLQTGIPILNQPCIINLSKSGKLTQMSMTAKRIYVNGHSNVLLSFANVLDESVELSNKLNSLSQQETSAALANIGFWELDLQTFVTQGSEVWNRLLGFDEGEEQDFDIWSINIPPQQYKELMHKITLLVRNEGQDFEHRFSYNNAGLGEKWLNIKAYVSQFSQDGRPSKIVGLVQDVTNIVRTEQELITQQANQKALLDNTEARIWLVDTQYKIIEMNDQFMRGFKALFSIEYIKGDSFIAGLPGEASRRWQNLLDKCFMGNSLQVSDTITLQNSDRHFETRLTPVSVEDTVVAVSCYLTEVTVQKRYEQMLKLARKTAEEANKAKSQFLANMSHEIRTPLNAILGFSEILEATEIEPEKTAYLQSIKKSGTMLLSIINDVLDLSKIEAGKISVNPEFTDVHSLLTDTFDPFVFRAAQKKLDFSIDLSDIDQYLLFIDGFRFRQIILNLLSNAIKFTESGEIRCVATLNRQSDTAVELTIQISDTGIGIDNNQLEAIFSPFQQQENQDSRKYEGTGLGLSITKQLVELLGGNINVESSQNSGSLFAVNFPHLEFREQKSVKEIVVAQNRSLFNFAGKLALVADDLPDHRKVIGGYLSLYGMKVVYASDGADVFSQLETIIPDVVFMDLRMPGINGYQAFAELKKNELWQNIPVVAVTAEAFATEEDIVGDKGFSYLIRKPIELNNIHSVLLQIFKHSAPLREMESTVTKGASDDFVEQLRLMATPLLRKQPRKDLLKLAEFMIKEGADKNLDRLVATGGELNTATSTFNIAKIREIISGLV